MVFQFQKATKKGTKARIALLGPSGSGKTYTALRVANALGNKIAVVDTEHKSASKYSDKCAFDVIELDSFSVENYIACIDAAAKAGYDVNVIDSLSHAWAGKDGMIEFVDKERIKSKSGDGFGAWRKATPKHNELVEALLKAPLHVIVTMRVKTEYVVEKDDRGKNVPRKVGLQPIQRDGLEYEFDVVADIDLDHNLSISKTRCPDIDGKVFHKPGPDFAAPILAWLSDATDDVPAPDRSQTAYAPPWQPPADAQEPPQRPQQQPAHPAGAPQAKPEAPDEDQEIEAAFAAAKFSAAKERAMRQSAKTQGWTKQQLLNAIGGNNGNGNGNRNQPVTAAAGDDIDF